MLRYSKYFYTASLVLVALSIISLSLFGLRLGTDFTGGSLLEFRFADTRPNETDIRNTLTPLNLGSVDVRTVGTSEVILRFKEIDEMKHQEIIKAFPGVEELRFDSVGPVIGEETKKKSLLAIALVAAMILIYIALAFRKISFPISSTPYGVIAVLTLSHNILITAGVFAALGRFMQVEIGVPFVAALLTILGYSINDTIVVFDRIRENLLKRAGRRTFEDAVNTSVRETLMRSFGTSFTTLLVLITLFLFGGESIRYFALALGIGVIVGTYASIFLASPLLISWFHFKRKR